MNVVVSEAYSANNLGDGELVAATVTWVRNKWPDAHVTVVALEPASFDGLVEADAVCSRLFDRRRLRNARPVAKLALLLRWFAFVSLSTALSMAGRRTLSGIVARFLLGIEAMPAYVAYCSADAQVAVGGGYLGDRYAKESFLTLWSWWWARRRGVSVETMPISIEADGRMMQTLLRAFARGVVIRVRDHASVEVTEGLGLHPSFSPDLAFRHRVDMPVAERGDRVWLFPVGSDYFSPEVWRRQWRTAAEVVAASGREMMVYSMHRPLTGTAAGRDDEASEFLVGLGANRRYDISSYGALVSELREDAHVVVTARMHAGIAALCAGVPVVFLGYEEKHRTLLRMLDLEELYRPLDGFDHEVLAEVVKTASELDPVMVAARVDRFLSCDKVWG